MSVKVTTLGDIRLVASCKRRDGGFEKDNTVEFRTERGDLAAACALSEFAGGARFVGLKAGDAAWELGPVDVAMINSLSRNAG